MWIQRAAAAVVAVAVAADVLLQHPVRKALAPQQPDVLDPVQPANRHMFTAMPSAAAAQHTPGAAAATTEPALCVASREQQAGIQRDGAGAALV